jgi:hypothetical protein
VSKVLTAPAVSIDGCIADRHPADGRWLGDGPMLFDWYFDGNTQSHVFEPSTAFPSMSCRAQ